MVKYVATSCQVNIHVLIFRSNVVSPYLEIQHKRKQVQVVIIILGLFLNSFRHYNVFHVLESSYYSWV